MKSAEEWGEVATNHVKYRSPSQLNQYQRCPYSYYLARRERVWERPAAWLAHGTAVHRAVELWEQSGRVMTPDETVQAFSDSYRAEINALLKENPNPKSWFASGPYGGLKDIPRRAEVGKEHVLNVLRFYREHPDMKPWVDPSGKMWVEKEFKVKFGDVEVVGYIDVVIDEKPVDYKTGSTPGFEEQLATYGGVLYLEWDIPFTEGFFFLARAGKPTRPYDLTGWSIQRLTDVYGELDENIKGERFDPTPSPDVCGRCPVSTSCEFAQIG